MSDREKYANLVERYLDGELEGDALLAFEKELATNMELREHLELYQLANAAIIQHKIARVGEIVREVGEDYRTRRDSGRWFRGLAWGSLVMATVSTGVFLSQRYDREKEDRAERGMGRMTDSLLVVAGDGGVVRDEDDLATGEWVDSAEKKRVAKSRLSASEKENKEINVNSGPAEAIKAEAPDGAYLTDTMKKPSLIDASDLEEKVVFVQPGNTTADLVPYEDNAMTASLDVKPTCAGKREGSVTVENIRGGVGPYRFYLSSGEENTHGVFLDLEAGVYAVRVLDSDQRELHMADIVIVSERCRQDFYLDPLYGAPVVFTPYEKAGVLTIFDKGGNARFTKNVFEHQAYEWFGEANDGKLSPGYYLFVIRYEDGVIQNGSITVTP